MIPLKESYLSELCSELEKQWPDNRTVNIVCHGHSVPAGYAKTPLVDTFHAYPHLLHRALKNHFPFAVVNVIVTAVGGENSVSGAKRFDREVLCHRPDLVLLDYGLNDRAVGLEAAQTAWRKMIEASQRNGVKVMLLTPSWDESWFTRNEDWKALCAHADQIRALAEEYGAALGDSFAAFDRYVSGGGDLSDLLSFVNHPSPLGHELIAKEIIGYFPGCSV